MRKIPFLILTAAILTGCGKSASDNDSDMLIADMNANLSHDDFSEVSVTDVHVTPLDTATIALLGDNADIVGIIADTVIISDMNSMGGDSRLLMFNSKNGELIRTISHVGQGPGEYSWIENVVTIPEKNQMILLASQAHRYTTDDHYIQSYAVPRTHGGKLPVGSAERGVHFTDGFEGNFYIYQYDADMNPVDTIVFTDYEPKWISIAYNLSDQDPLLNIVDTIYSLYPGGMEPVAVLSRGEKALTPEVEKKVYIGQTDFEKAQRERQAYIDFHRFLIDGPRMIVYYSYGGRDYTDIYSRKTSKLIARRSFTYDDDDAGLTIPYKDTEYHHITPLTFLKDGRFYALINEEEFSANNPDAVEPNSALISWRLEGE